VRRNTSQFAADEILLELITDDQVDGWALAQWTVENVQSEVLRRELGELLRRWSGEADRPIEPTQVVARRRIVIFGGHQRDESKKRREFVLCALCVLGSSHFPAGSGVLRLVS
jgi:hypothetical protein